MNRLLSILVSLFVLFLIYLWINHIMTSTPRSEIEDQTSSRVMAEEEKADVLKKYDFSEGTQETEEPAQSSGSDATTDEEQPPSGQQEELATEPEEVPREEEPAPPVEVKPVPTPPPSSASENPQGIHLVIAGNFLERGNAEKRVNQLRENGFANAEVVNFQLSQYHTACAGRYNDIAEARRMAKKLKDFHGIDAYVRYGN